MKTMVQRCNRIARTGMTVLLVCLAASIVCLGFFIVDQDNDLLILAGIIVLVLGLLSEVVCMRISRKIFLKAYSRMGMARQSGGNQLNPGDVLYK